MGRKKCEPNYAAPALEKGLAVLETLAQSDRPMSLAELARLQQRNPSEVFRMVDCLHKRGYLLRDESGSFSLSLKLFELAHTHSPMEKLLSVAQLPMRELTEKVSESCHLGVLRHGELLVLAETPAATRIRLSVEVGGRFPPLQTVSGRLLFAHMPADAAKDFLRSIRPAINARRESQLFKESEKIRAQSFALGMNESIEGVRDVAVPVGNSVVGVSASLAVASLIINGKASDLDTLLTAMKDCARRINRQLGLSS